MRAALHTLFDEAPAMSCVGEAANERDTVDLVSSKTVDVLLLDTSLSGMSAWNVLGKVMELAPRTRVLIFASYGGEWLQKMALAKGACGWISADEEPARIVRAVRKDAAP